ncbi:MAG: hypothetical protein R3B89_01460 [Polyangiaceae bacterium]
MKRRGLLVFLGLLLTGCPEDEPKDELVERAVFGVFFGGQVQERNEVPFEIDRRKQTQGLRVDFQRALTRDVPIRWEWDRPAPRGKRPTHSSRVTELGSGVAPKGSQRFETQLELAPGDPLGEWNVRLFVDDRLVLDQRFLVYSEASRRAAERRNEDEDD